MVSSPNGSYPYKNDRLRILLSELLAPLVMLLLFLAVIFIFYPFRQIFEINPDEGIELMKGLLVEQGYTMYSEVWSDQPPLFINLLALLFRFVGYNVNAGRILVLSFSCALLIAAYTNLRLVWGTGHAIAGMFILILLPTVPGLSVSTMIGLPAIALAMISLAALTAWHQQGKVAWLILSAVTFCLSIFTKVFTAILGPVFLLGILLGEYRRTGSWQRALRPVIIWGGIFGGLSILLMLLLIGPGNLWHLILPHIAAGRVSYYQDRVFDIGSHLRGYWPILLLAMVGIVFVLQKRRWLSLYAVAWMVMGYLFLWQNTPVRYHHRPLVSVPAACLAGVAIAEVVRSGADLVKSRKFLTGKALIPAVVLFLLLSTLAIRVPGIRHNPGNIRRMGGDSAQIQFIQKLYKFAPQTSWVITDKPMYAFRVGLPVPPSTAEMTRKRVVTSYITEEQLIDAVKTYRPEQVLLGRFDFPELERYLEADYRLVYSRKPINLYVRKGIKESVNGTGN